MSLFNKETREQLEKVLKVMKDNVNVLLFTDSEDCESCEDTHNFVEEISQLNHNIKFESFDVLKNKDVKEKYNVERVPTIILLDKDEKDHGIKFGGIPAGHEINSFVSGLIEVSGERETFPAEMMEELNKVDKKIDIKVFVTLGCPHCSGAVSKAHRLALQNDWINAEMIECATFPEMAEKYNVSGVPKIVINGSKEIMGNQPMDKFVEAIREVI